MLLSPPVVLVMMAASAAAAAGHADLSGAALDAGETAAEPIDVNGLQHAALLSALLHDARLKGMPEPVMRRIAAERQQRPFDSVADMTRRVNASATSMRDRLGQTYLPFLRVSAPECQSRVLYSPTGSILGGVLAPTVPEIARVTARTAQAACCTGCSDNAVSVALAPSGLGLPAHGSTPPHRDAAQARRLPATARCLAPRRSDRRHELLAQLP